MTYFKKIMFGLVLVLASFVMSGIGFAASVDLDLFTEINQFDVADASSYGGSGSQSVLNIDVANHSGSVVGLEVVLVYPTEATYVNTPGWQHNLATHTLIYKSDVKINSGDIYKDIVSPSFLINNNYTYREIVFTGTVSPTATDTDTVLTNNSNSASRYIGYSGSLSKTGSSSALPGFQYANKGDSVTYTLSYYNTGTMTVAANFTDNLPSGFVVSQAYSSPGSCVSQLSLLNGGISINNLNVLFAQNCQVLPGSTGTIVIVGSFVNPVYDTNNAISNTVSVQLYSTQGSILGSPLSASTLVYGYPVISSFSKITTGALPQQINDDVYYTVTITNSGSVAAQNLFFTDTPPLGLTYVDSIPSLPSPLTNPLNTDLTWNLTIPAQSTVTYTLRFKINNIGLLSAGSFVNQGFIEFGASALSGSLVDTDDGSSATTQVAGLPYVTLTKSIVSPNASGHVYQSGDTVTYHISLTNTGTWTATGTITDILPSYFTGWSSSLLPSTSNSTTRTRTGFSLNPGQTRTIVLTGILKDDYPANTVYTNTANFALTSPAIGTVVNNGTVTGTIFGRSNILINKTMIGSTQNATLSGDIVSYQLSVTQDGTLLYTGSVCVNDVLPNQISYLTSSLASSNCNGPLSWSGTLPFSLILTGQLNTSLSMGEMITNTGSVKPLQNIVELNLSDNTDAVSFVAGGFADMKVGKNVVSPVNGISGSKVSYIIDYINTSTTMTASGVVVEDIFPYPLVYSGQVSGLIQPTATSVATGTKLVWNIGNVLPGGSGSFVIEGYFSGFVSTGTINNTVKLTSSTPDTDLNNNTYTVSSPIVSVADVSINKTILTPAGGFSGSLVSFHLYFANNGLAPATGIVIQDLLPNTFTYLSHTSTIQDGTGPIPFKPIGATNTLQTDSFSLSPGQTGYIIFTGYLNTQPTTGFSYTNTAIATGSFLDGNVTNNISSVSANVNVSIGCSLSKEEYVSPWSLYSPGGVDLSGKLVGYKITLHNNGTVPLNNIILQDTWPSSELTSPFATTITGISLPVGGSGQFILTGALKDRTVGSLLNSATATFAINGVNFSCSATGDVQKVPLSCNNGYLEADEQCDTYAGTTYVFNGNSLVNFSSNSFSFDGGSSTQICNANCKIQTVSVNNCASMTVPGTDPSTLTGCAPLIGLEDPLLTLTKTVTPINNLALGSTVRYTIFVANNSSGDAYNVSFSDVFPRSSLEYVGNLSTSSGVSSVSVSTGSQTFTGNLGAMPIGSTRTISFDAKIISTTPSTIVNTALVNYTNASNISKPQLSDSVSLTIGSAPIGSCGDGVKASNESCDLGNGGGVIVNYLDTTSNYPSSSSSRGSLCTSSCQIDASINRCGDGRLGRLEMCDMGVDGSQLAPITNDLNNQGTLVSAGVYANTGFSCNSSCELIKPGVVAQMPGVVAQMPACWASDSVISVMEGEALPVVWDVELDKSGMVSSQSQCNNSNKGSVIQDSLRCTIKLYNKNEEAENGVTLIENLPCNMKEISLDSNLLDPFANTLLKTAYGSFLVEMTDSMVNNGYGEYKLSLDKVDYRYCSGVSSSEAGNPYGRVCQVNVAVTKPYLMQKSNTVFKPSYDLQDFFTLAGENFVKATQFDSIREQTTLSSLEYKGKIQTLSQDLLKKYEKIAIKVPLDGDVFPGVDGALIKKVPGKSLYILEGSSSSEFTFAPGSSINTPTTLIVKKGNLAIVGSVNSNVLILVPDGYVRFDVGEEDMCTKPQTIRGIVVAKKFEPSKKDLRNTKTNIENDVSRVRCSRGNLHVYGALYGDDIESLVSSRRSELEQWFTYKSNFGLTSAPSESKVNSYRRDLIYKGASVYIEQTPDLWRSMPPGADTFLNTLNISRN